MDCSVSVVLVNSLHLLGQGYKKGNLQRGVLRMTEEENMENAGSNDRSPKRQERKEHWEELKNSCF